MNHQLIDTLESAFEPLRWPKLSFYVLLKRKGQQRAYNLDSEETQVTAHTVSAISKSPFEPNWGEDDF